MNHFWTSKHPINGLRHFVLVNKTKEQDKIYVLLVSAIDNEVFLKITYQELINSDYWEKGWLKLSKSESISKGYVEYKSICKKNELNKIFIEDDSLFNIS